MYEKIKELIMQEGDKLAQISGTVKDGYNAKEWTTEHDDAIENKFVELIATFGQDHHIYGEESHFTFSQEDNIWIIDPISHTINFIHGMPHYAVVVSHVHKGEVQFGAVYDPSMKELYSAEKGKGSYLNGKKIQVQDSEYKPLIILNPYPMGNWKMDETLEIYRKIAPLGYIDAIGSMGLQFAYVASGKVQLVVMPNKDTFPLFAGKILVEEAGGIFTDFEGNPLDTESRGVIAGTTKYYTEALKALTS